MYHTYVRSSDGKVRRIEADNIRDLWVKAYRLTRFWRKKCGVTFRIYDDDEHGDRFKYKRYEEVV